MIWLRQYPTNEVLGFLFGVSDSTASRILSREVPLLEAAGKDTMRLPDPGRKHRKEMDDLLKETPELAVIIDTLNHTRGQRGTSTSGPEPIDLMWTLTHHEPQMNTVSGSSRIHSIWINRLSSVRMN